MWTCQNCETCNNTENCIVCGNKRPYPEIYTKTQEYPVTNSDQQFVNNSRDRQYNNVPKKRTNALIVVCIIVGMLLVATTAFLVGVLISNQSNKTSSDLPSNVTHSESVSYQSDEEQNIDEADDTEIYDNEFDDSDTSESDYSPLVIDGEEYGMYKSIKYNFYCAYPAYFYEVPADGINALKKYESPDGTAVMTIRASENSDNITIYDAMNDYKQACGGIADYSANGDTWFAMASEYNGRSYYRKLFITAGNIYCMDFEMNTHDEDYYGPFIEVIEDNFHYGEFVE